MNYVNMFCFMCVLDRDTYRLSSYLHSHFNSGRFRPVVVKLGDIAPQWVIGSRRGAKNWRWRERERERERDRHLSDHIIWYTK